MAKMRNSQTVSWIVCCTLIASCVKICMESLAVDAYAIDCLMPYNETEPCADACCNLPLMGCCWCYHPDANLSSIIGPCSNLTTATSSPLHHSNAVNDSAANQTLTTISPGDRFSGTTNASVTFSQGSGTTNASANNETTSGVSGQTVSTISPNASRSKSHHNGSGMTTSKADALNMAVTTTFKSNSNPGKLVTVSISPAISSPATPSDHRIVPEDSDDMPPWAIALLAVLAVCLLFLLAFLILVILKWKKRKNKIDDLASIPPLSSRAPSATCQRPYHTFENQETPRDSRYNMSDSESESSDSPRDTNC